MFSMWKRVAVAAGLLATLSTAQAMAQTSEEDLRVQPYVFGSVGTFPSGAGGEITYGFGLGTDYLAYKGLGLGGSFVIFGNNTFGFGVASFDVSYHFIGSGRYIPFVKASIGGGGEIGYGGVPFAGFGGGVNLWNLGGAAIRIEIIDRFPVDGGDHHINFQVGVTF